MAEKVATFGQRLREGLDRQGITPVSYTHLRAHET